MSPIKLKDIERTLRAAHRLLGKLDGQLRDEQLLRAIGLAILQVDHGEVALPFERSELEGLSLSFSDLLCWHRGFAVAREQLDHSNDPMGINELREFNIAIKRALED